MSKTLFFFVTVVLLIVTSTSAANKVVVIPLSSTGPPSKLWGEGRVGTSAIIDTIDNGVKIARSNGLASWDGAAAACPKDTWVCTLAEVENLSISSATPYVTVLSCDGKSSYSAQVSWVQDEDTYRFGMTAGVYETWAGSEDYFFVRNNALKCSYYPVWCCSDAY